jgi:hypothetical protein
MRFIFDLDMTTVDSSHRQHFVNGKLDLCATRCCLSRDTGVQRFALALRLWFALRGK